MNILKNIEILEAGAKGKALGKAEDGRIVFVPFSVPGDNIDVRITKKKKKYYEGTIYKINKFSEKRVEPKCEYFGVCGGCKWQNMDYDTQLFFKQKEVSDNLKKIANIDLEINKIIPSEHTFHYRNKIEYSFSNNRWITEEEIKNNQQIDNRDGVGFHIPGRWDKILDIDKCHLQEDISNKIRNRIKQLALKRGYDFYDIKEHRGLLRSLMIRITSIGQIMVLIQFGEDDRDKIVDILEDIYKNFGNSVDSLLYTINKKYNDTIYDQDITLYKGKHFIEEEMDDLIFKISAKSFYQTNSIQAHNLYKLVRDMADISKGDLVYDLYTGTGTIALFNSKYAKKIIGIESVPEAIEDAICNAKKNQINNVEFFVGDMKNIFDDDFLKNNGKPDIIITDPPRDGMHRKVVEKILDIMPKKIVYVSCNSSTQARDLNIMKERYVIKKIQPIDMFPHTHHVENVVLLESR